MNLEFIIIIVIISINIFGFFEIIFTVLNYK